MLLKSIIEDETKVEPVIDGVTFGVLFQRMGLPETITRELLAELLATDRTIREGISQVTRDPQNLVYWSQRLADQKTPVNTPRQGPVREGKSAGALLC